jgi:hypothetical protein
MPFARLETKLEIDVSFHADGMLLMSYSEAGNPGQTVSWSDIEQELLYLGTGCDRNRADWANEMEVANQFIRLGLKLRKAMAAIKDECDRDPQTLVTN